MKAKNSKACYSSSPLECITAIKNGGYAASPIYINTIMTIINSNNLTKYDENNKNEEGFEMKLYQNGTTSEIVYQDVNCTKQIGYLHPHEQASCYGIIENKALIVYNIDGTNNLKSGFVKWLGGVQQ